jgi:hypothetical protein
MGVAVVGGLIFLSSDWVILFRFSFVVLFLGWNFWILDREASATKVSVSAGIMNFVGCWFGAMPVCHTAMVLVGLQGSTGLGVGAVCLIFLGSGKLVLGLVFGNSFARIFESVSVLRAWLWRLTSCVHVTWWIHCVQSQLAINGRPGFGWDKNQEGRFSRMHQNSREEGLALVVSKLFLLFFLYNLPIEAHNNPIGIFGVLLLFTGIELAMACRDVNTKEESFVMLLCAAFSLTGSSAALGAGFCSSCYWNWGKWSVLVLNFSNLSVNLR